MDRDAHDRKRDVQAMHEEQQEGCTGDTDSGAEQRREHVVERLGDGRTGHAHSEQTDVTDHVGKAVHHVEHEHRDADEVLFEALRRNGKEHQEYRFHDEHRDDELRHIDTEHHLAFFYGRSPHCRVGRAIFWGQSASLTLAAHLPEPSLATRVSAPRGHYP